ncbi:MAG TPA: CPBP family glutamic-type intramembrane protease [Planctomycetota bacterium]
MILEQQTATASFYVPVVAAWVAIFLGLEVARRLRRSVWPAADTSRSWMPRLDLGIALLVAAAIIGLGQVWRDGWLRWRWPGAWDHLAFLLQQLIIWSPLPFALWFRRQKAASAWTGPDHLATRLLVGFVLGAIGVTFYLAARGELSRWPSIANEALTLRALAYAAPVYLEGVGLAYVFVRLRWAVGRWLAALIPGLLFALAHVPGSGNDSAATTVSFFVFNTVFVTIVLLVLARYRDVVALGVAHWLMDLATDAF